MGRTASVTRKTAETDISLFLDLDGSGKAAVNTGIGFLDHMLVSLARHGFLDLEVSCTGDLSVDSHHTIEDTGIVLGMALDEALGGKEGIARFGSALLPMDDALLLCAVDLSGRAYLSFDVPFAGESIGAFDTAMAREFFYAVALHGKMNLHLKKLSGINDHHVLEAAFKAFARALSAAAAPDKRVAGVLSAKGSLS